MQGSAVPQPCKCKVSEFLLKLVNARVSMTVIVGKGVIPPFSKIPAFLEIQDVPTFNRLIEKTRKY